MTGSAWWYNMIHCLFAGEWGRGGVIAPIGSTAASQMCACTSRHCCACLQIRGRLWPMNQSDHSWGPALRSYIYCVHLWVLGCSRRQFTHGAEARRVSWSLSGYNSKHTHTRTHTHKGWHIWRACGLLRSPWCALSGYCVIETTALWQLLVYTLTTHTHSHSQICHSWPIKDMECVKLMALHCPHC